MAVVISGTVQLLIVINWKLPSAAKFFYFARENVEGLLSEVLYDSCNYF